MYIYIHIPFCNSICSYCDFAKVYYDKKYINRYLLSLEKEIRNRYQNELVKTIYIGGGTPTSLDKEELERLLKITDIFKRESSIEFTVESNIESLDEEKIKCLVSYGVNRISLGVQSFQDKNLLELNRGHTREMILNIVNKLKENHLMNISIDYIYGLNENIEEVKDDIEAFLDLDIPHISCYSLIIENNTMFGINKREYIDEDVEYEMYKLISKTLKENHYIQYEISNYARDGYESIHNLGYWNNLEYYGFGLGAVSYLDNFRITNTRNLTKYLKDYLISTKEYEGEATDISNTLILGLRKIKGINISDFEKRYQRKIEDFPNIVKLIQEKKLKIEKNYLFINEEYLYLSNEIFIDLLSILEE